MSVEVFGGVEELLCLPLLIQSVTFIALSLLFVHFVSSPSSLLVLSAVPSTACV